MEKSKFVFELSTYPPKPIELKPNIMNESNSYSATAAKNQFVKKSNKNFYFRNDEMW